MNSSTTHSPTQPTHTIIIQVDRFQPFKSRLGLDEVMRLQFDYDPALVSRLKAILSVYAVGGEHQTIGGWLAKHRCWFVEVSAWEVVKLELLCLGHRIIKGNT